MSVFHVKYPTSKHVENSLRGVDTAWRRGFDEIDIDMLPDAEGNVYGNHWPRPMEKDGFRDPLRRMPRNKTIQSMTPRQVRRLIARTGRRFYRIQRIERLIQQCAKRGIGAVLEPKDDPIFRTDAFWNHIAKVADDCGAHVRVYGFDEKNIAAAKRNGFKAREIR